MIFASSVSVSRIVDSVCLFPSGNSQVLPFYSEITRRKWFGMLCGVYDAFSHTWPEFPHLYRDIPSIPGRASNGKCVLRRSSSGDRLQKITWRCKMYERAQCYRRQSSITVGRWGNCYAFRVASVLFKLLSPSTSSILWISKNIRSYDYWAIYEKYIHTHTHDVYVNTHWNGHATDSVGIN